MANGAVGAYGAMGAQGALQMLRAAIAQRQQQALENALKLRAADRADSELGLQRDRLTQQGSQFDQEMGLSRDKFGFEQQQWTDNAPQRAANLRMTTAQATDMEGKPAREQAQRDFQMGLENLRNTNELGQIDRRVSGQLRVVGAETAARQAEAKAKAEAQAQAGANPQDEYGRERTSRIITSIDEVLPQVSNWTAGPGSVLTMIPGSPATDMEAKLKEISANIAFNELSAMRAASKTGGALGAVSERELALLESALGAIQNRQSPEALKANLEKIRGSLERWQQAQGGSAVTVRMRAPNGQMKDVPADQVEFYRSRGAEVVR